MNPVTNDILKDQIRWTKEKYPGSPFVFPGRAGGQRVECTAIRRIKKVAKRAARVLSAQTGDKDKARQIVKLRKSQPVS